MAVIVNLKQSMYLGVSLYINDFSFHSNLKNHLKYFMIWRILINCCCKLFSFLLDILNCNFDWSQYPLYRRKNNHYVWTKGLLPQSLPSSPSSTTHRHPVDDLDPGLDVGEHVLRGEHGLALVLLLELAVSAAVGRERSREDEPLCV